MTISPRNYSSDNKFNPSFKGLTPLCSNLLLLLMQFRNSRFGEKTNHNEAFFLNEAIVKLDSGKYKHKKDLREVVKVLTDANALSFHEIAQAETVTASVKNLPNKKGAHGVLRSYGDERLIVARYHEKKDAEKHLDDCYAEFGGIDDIRYDFEYINLGLDVYT